MAYPIYFPDSPLSLLTTHLTITQGLMNLHYMFVFHILFNSFFVIQQGSGINYLLKLFLVHLLSLLKEPL